MYRQYKHKLNMLEPGRKFLGIIGILIFVGSLFRLTKLIIISNMLFITAGILGLIFLALLVIEQHQDKVLNEQAIRLDAKLTAAIQKKSFVLNFNNGSIWCEHLDSMGDNKEKVIDKFHQDILQFSRIDMPTYVAIDLDETKVDQEILSMIVNALINAKQSLRKVVFIGLSRSNQRNLETTIRKESNVGFRYTCINDFEKAKEWLI